MGGRVRYFVSGGAPLSPEITRFLLLPPGSRSSRATDSLRRVPWTNLNTTEHLRIGTVGRPIPGTEIRIGEGGEILVRGPQVMKGYYALSEATAKAIDSEGWFYTGDVGEIDEDGFLRITDRIKDIIVTAGGKNVAPQPIENRLKGDDFIEQAVMLGDRRSILCSPRGAELSQPRSVGAKEWDQCSRPEGVTGVETGAGAHAGQGLLPPRRPGQAMRGPRRSASLRLRSRSTMARYTHTKGQEKGRRGPVSESDRRLL